MTPCIFQMGPLSSTTNLFRSRGPVILPVDPGLGGTTPVYNMGVSIESGVFYFSIEDQKNGFARFDAADYKNKWVHFAISRVGDTIRFFKNGVQFGTYVNTSQPGAYDIFIGTDSTLTNSNTFFGGYIYGFQISNGIGRYVSNFIVPQSPPVPDSQTIHYLTGNQSLGTYGNTETKYNITTTPNTPFYIPVATTIARNYNRILHIEAQPRAVLTNNLVYYKPGTLAGCGVGGSAGNTRVKQRRT